MMKPRKNILLVFLFLFIYFLILGNRNAGAKVTTDVNRVVLKNGLTILLEEVKDSPLVSINIFVRAGSRDETPSKEGISHFLEHLFFRGTWSSTGSEFKSSLEALGGLCNAETTKDYTRYYINIPAVYGMKGLQLITDAILNASFDEKEIEQERKVIIEEYKITSDDPMRLIYDKLYEMAFPSHPYGKSIIGTEKNLKNFKRFDFLEYRRRFYSPEKLIFVIVGNINKQKAISYISDVYSNIPGGDLPENIVPAEKKLTESKENAIQKPVSDTQLAIAFYGPSVRDKKYIYSVDLLSYMIGIGDSSLLYRELVTQKGLLKDIKLNFLTQKDPGIITLFATLKNQDINAVKKEINSIIEKTINGEFNDDDIKRARNLLINSFVFGSETNDGKASNIGFYEAIDTYEFSRDYIQNIKNLKKEDIMNAAKKFLTPQYFSLVIKPDPRKKAETDED